MSELEALAQSWQECKTREKAASNRRKQIETDIVQIMGVDHNKPGTATEALQDVDIKAVSKINSSVDTEVLMFIASTSSELAAYAEKLFRFKFEVNAKEWADAPQHIQEVFEDAITTKPARPQISITKRTA